MKIPGAVFYPDDVEVLDQAMAAASGAIPAAFKSAELETQMAERILTAASRGQRDPGRLANSALARFSDFVSSRPDDAPPSKPAGDMPRAD